MQKYIFNPKVHPTNSKTFRKKATTHIVVGKINCECTNPQEINKLPSQVQCFIIIIFSWKLCCMKIRNNERIQMIEKIVIIEAHLFQKINVHQFMYLRGLFCIKLYLSAPSHNNKWAKNTFFNSSIKINLDLFFNVHTQIIQQFSSSDCEKVDLFLCS